MNPDLMGLTILGATGKKTHMPHSKCCDRKEMLMVLYERMAGTPNPALLSMGWVTWTLVRSTPLENRTGAAGSGPG